MRSPPALIFGGGITALALVRALGRAGTPALVATHDAPLVRHSRWYRPAPHPAPPETADGDVVAAYLGALGLDGGVTFPASDDWALALARLPPDVAAAFRPTTASAPTLLTLVDKAAFARAATAADVPVPRTREIHAAADVAAMPASELEGCFLKPVDSHRFNLRYAVKGLPVRDAVSAAADVERLHADGHALVLQEFIPGPRAAHVFLDGYVDRAGRTRARLARRRVRMFPPDLGNSTLSVTISIDRVRPAAASLDRLFEAIGFHGFFDAEFKFDTRDGVFKLLEVNARPWWQYALAERSGLAITMLAYRDALGAELADAPPAPPGLMWVNPGPDLRAWIADGFPRPTPLRTLRAEANALWALDDLGPGFGELARLPRWLATAAAARR